jgi:hypothetical protein
MQLHSLFILLNTGLHLERLSYPHSLQPKELISLDSGYAIEYYLINGKRMPVWFWGKEIIIVTSPYSIVEYLGEGNVSRVSHKDIRHMLRKFEDARKVYKGVREKMHAAIKERVHEISHLTPAERYIKLLETKPWVFEHAEEEDIAGYLGMTREQYRGMRMES